MSTRLVPETMCTQLRSQLRIYVCGCSFAGAMSMLYFQLGWASLVSFLVLVLCIPVQVSMSSAYQLIKLMEPLTPCFILCAIQWWKRHLEEAPQTCRHHGHISHGALALSFGKLRNTTFIMLGAFRGSLKGELQPHFITDIPWFTTDHARTC